MLRVFHDAGFELAREPDGGVVHLRFPVAETPHARLAHEQREHLAEARSIARLLAPRALWLGGERREDAARLRELGFRGAIHADAEGIPSGVDLALYAGASADVPALIARCAHAAVHALALGALSGEPPGDERDAFERELATAVRRNGMRLVGPGALGLINTAADVGLCSAPLARAPARGALGLACDSPEHAAALLEHATRAGVGVSTFAALGRRVDVSANDLLQYWQDDPSTRVVGLAFARCGNPRKFERIAARIAAKKSLLALATNEPDEDALLARVGAELASSPAELVARARQRL
jgi:acyl-CoA synthetase (NDP forming)